MARQAVIDTVMARLKANFTVCQIPDQDTASQAPADGSTFLTLQFPVASEQQITVGTPGNNVWREAGAFRLVISVRIGDPFSEANGWLDQARALFRGRQFSGVTTFAPSRSVEADPQFSGGLRVELSSAVPYQSDFIA
jgi:hypothetical protein